MNFLYWNIQGIDNDISQNMLGQHYQSTQLDWLCLMEPKIQFDSIQGSFWSSMGFQLAAQNTRDGMLPNIWVFCSSRIVNHFVIHSSDQIIILEATSSLILTVLVLYIRMHLIYVVENYAGLLFQFDCRNFLWDFNVVLGAHEHKYSFSQSDSL